MEAMKSRIADAVREETMNRIAKAVAAELGEGFGVRPREVNKNNGVIRHGVAIAKSGAAVSPIIYADGMLDGIESGEVSVLEAANEIVDIYKERIDDCIVLDNGIKHDRQGILEGVTYELVNAEKNRERLSEIPHRGFLDLAAIYSAPIIKDGSVVASFVVNNQIRDGYGISEEELDAAARKNTEMKGFAIRPLTSILEEILGVGKVDAEFQNPLIVLTNELKHKGAAVMLYNEHFERIAWELGSDLYVLPSSVHEVIAVPVDAADVGSIRQMVKEVNATEISDEEFLSDSVYRYVRAENRLVIA